MFAEVCLEKPLVLLSESQSGLNHKSFHSNFKTDFDTPFIYELHRNSRVKGKHFSWKIVIYVKTWPPDMSSLSSQKWGDFSISF